MSNSKELFARNLKKCRLAAGLSQVKLAQNLSYTGKAVSKWESGTAMPPAEILPKLAKALDTDLNTLFDFREAPSYFLGIDGGGTKTRFMITDINGNTIKTLTLGACNPASVGMDTTISILNEGIKTICDGIPTGKISVFAGIAGCGVGKNRKTVLSVFDKFKFSKADASNDAENIISAGLQGKDGIIAILGTGSVIFTVSNGIRRRIGGYGHIIGDCFSGSEFGKICLKSAFYHIDGSGPHTAMTEKVKNKLGNDIFIGLSELYSQDKAYMASFAPDFFEACAENDALALKALEDNINMLSTQLTAALKHFRPEDSVPIVLSGGITNFSAQFLNKLKSKITDERLKTVEIFSGEPVLGAVLLAGAPTISNDAI